MTSRLCDNVAMKWNLTLHYEKEIDCDMCCSIGVPKAHRGNNESEEAENTTYIPYIYKACQSNICHTRSKTKSSVSQNMSASNTVTIGGSKTAMYGT